MPRQRSLLRVIRDTVQQEVRSAIQSLLGSVSTGTKAKNGRRRKRRGKWRPGGPGRPPKTAAEKIAQKKPARATPGVGGEDRSPPSEASSWRFTEVEEERGLTAEAWGP